MNVNNPRKPTALVDKISKTLYVLHPTIQDNPDKWNVFAFTINQHNQPTDKDIKFILNGIKNSIYENNYIPKSGNYQTIYLKS